MRLLYSILTIFFLFSGKSYGIQIFIKDELGNSYCVENTMTLSQCLNAIDNKRGVKGGI